MNYRLHSHGTSLGTAIGAITIVLLGVSGCASDSGSTEATPSGNHFESDNPEESTFTDDAGNEMQVGQDLELPKEWPSSIPTPDGRLVAVSVVDQSTAVATWQIDGDVISAENNYLQELESQGFETTKSDDLSTESISVFFALGNGLDITVSATPGEQESDPGEITVVINPSL